MNPMVPTLIWGDMVVSEASQAPSPITQIANGNFDNDLNEWIKVGHWQISPSTWSQGKFAISAPPEAELGIMASKPFIISQPYLNFNVGGHDNTGDNRVQLYVEGNLEKDIGAPGSDAMVDVSWNVSSL